MTWRGCPCRMSARANALMVGFPTMRHWPTRTASPSAALRPELSLEPWSSPNSDLYTAEYLGPSWQRIAADE